MGRSNNIYRRALREIINPNSGMSDNICFENIDGINDIGVGSYIKLINHTPKEHIYIAVKLSEVAMVAKTTWDIFMLLKSTKLGHRVIFSILPHHPMVTESLIRTTTGRITYLKLSTVRRIDRDEDFELIDKRHPLWEKSELVRLSHL